MEQLLVHLVADFFLQTDKMAMNKRDDSAMCILHVFIYTLAFMVLTQSVWALTVIGVTHFLIDRFALAKYLIFAKNRIHDSGLVWDDCKDTGHHKDRPDFMRVWLFIIVDNTFHLCINYFAIKYL